MLALLHKFAVSEFTGGPLPAALHALNHFPQQLRQQYACQGRDDDTVGCACAAQHEILVNAPAPHPQGVGGIGQHHAHRARNECAAAAAAEDIGDGARRQAVEQNGVQGDALRLIRGKAADQEDGRAGQQRSQYAAPSFPGGVRLHKQINAQRQRNRCAAQVEGEVFRQADIRHKAQADDQRNEQQRQLIIQPQAVQHPLPHAQQDQYGHNHQKYHADGHDVPSKICVCSYYGRLPAFETLPQKLVIDSPFPGAYNDRISKLERRNMEIKYKRTYSPARGKRYTAGEITAMLGYAMEIAEPRLRLKEGRLAPGEVCMLLFGITPEEYALKDSDPRAMDALADQLLSQMPADRLMGWRILDLKGALVQKTVQPVTGESIDGGEFMRRLKEKTAQLQAGPIDEKLLSAAKLQKQAAAKDASEEIKEQWTAARRELGAALMNLEQTWVAYDALANDRWPSVGFDGRIEIFTTEQRARRVQQQVDNVHGGVALWSLRRLNRDELLTLLQACAGDGLDLLRIDNGFAAAQLQARDCCMHALQTNAALRSMLLREVQYGLRYGRFKDAPVEERIRRGALESMLTLRGFAWREIGNGSLWALCPSGDKGKCVMLGGKEGEKLLAVFTEAKRAQEFAKRLNPTIKPVEMKFDDLVQRCAAMDGLLIDYGFIGYRLLKQDFDKVIEMRAKPPVIVRVQPEGEKSASAQPRQASSLPNPDEFDVPAPAQAENPQPPEEHPAPQDPPKKGFLKKFFGK